VASTIGQSQAAINTTKKKRRVFTRRFVALCMFVAVMELAILHQVYHG